MAHVEKCPSCDKERFQSAETRTTHVKWCSATRKGRKYMATERLAQEPETKIKGTSLEALKESAYKEEERRRDNALLKQHDVPTDYPTPYRVTLVADLQAHSLVEARTLLKAHLKTLTKTIPELERPDVASILSV